MHLGKTFKRILGALRLSEDALYEIGMDRRETWQAVLLFALASLGTGFDWISHNSSWPVVLAVWMITAVLALGLVGEVARFSALFLFGGSVQRHEVVRLAGFSMVPMIFAGIPYINVLAALWALAIFYKGWQTYFALGAGRTIVLLFLSISAAFVFWALANAAAVAVLQTV